MSKKVLLAAVLVASLGGFGSPAVAAEPTRAVCNSFARYAAHWVYVYRKRGCSVAFNRPTSAGYYYQLCRSNPFHARSPRAEGIRQDLAGLCGGY